MPYLYGAQGRARDGLEPLAICGMACRLPGKTDSPSALWKLLLEKKSASSSKVPNTRFNIDAHFHKNLDRPGSFNVLGGYFLDGPAEKFDPTFFNITPVEAMWLDPQQRKMLEVCYEALESAGVTLESISGSNTGVWVGSFTADYQQMTFKDPDFRHSYAATGVDPGIISNRIGNIFDLNGPSCTINTACSSSVYAIHNACNSLRARDCDAALVGGVNLILTVDQHMNTAKLGVLSPTSFCHTFDESADGYGRGEGAGALYLKRLDDAIRDGDVVRAVIRSSAVNTNGKVPGYGITYPNVNGQERVIRGAYKRANLDPNDTAYFECHGTGTRVGDPIEVRAVSNAMNDTRSSDKPLIVGAVKPNIGHSEAASGIFAVMKAAMMVEAGLIPGVAGLKTVNHAIPEQTLNVKISKDTSSWPQGFQSRRASVSSFGYGGTNGHVIVENVEALEPHYQHGARKDAATYDHSSTRPLLVTLSSHDRTTLTRNIEAHAAVVDQYYLVDFAHTLNLRRSKFATRAFVVATEATAADDLATVNFKTGSFAKPIEQLAFIFTGQGAQWAGVGRDAIKAFPVFRETIRRLDRFLKTVEHPPNFSIEDELTAPPETSRINDANIAQPTLVATEIAIVDLLASWGIIPTATVGHSAGEYAAAYAAGLSSAAELIIAAYYRGYALSKYAPSGGSMMAVGLGADELEPYLPRLSPEIVIACENSPKSVTLSGPSAAIQEAKAVFDAEKIFARELRTGMAYHSPQMQPVAEPMVDFTRKACRKLDSLDRQWRYPRRTMISSVTNSPVADGEINPAYWATNLTGRVLFNTAVAKMASMEDHEHIGGAVEIGPHSALAGPFKQICLGHNLEGFTYFPTIIRNQDGAKSLLKTAGELFLGGYTVDLSQVNKVESQAVDLGFTHKRSEIKPLTLVDLPPYQWNYEKMYWAEPRASAEYRQLQHARHDLLGSKILGLASQSMAWRNVLRVKDVPWLAFHKLGGSNMFPAAGHMALAIEAARQRSEVNGVTVTGVTLRNFELKTALIVPDTDNGLEIQTRLTEIPSAPHSYLFTVASSNNDAWSIHSEGEIEVLTNESKTASLAHPVNLNALTQRHTGKRWNDAFRRVGFEYGRCFDSLERIRTNGKDYSAAGHMPITTESKLMVDESRYVIHPSTVDSLLQLCIISIHMGLYREMPWGVVPIKFEEVTLRFPEDAAGTMGHAVAWNPVRAVGARRFNTSAQLATADGKVVLDIRGLHTVAYEAALPPQVKSEVKLHSMPFAGVVWRPDVTVSSVMEALSLNAGAGKAADAVPEIIDLLNHKRPLSSLLVLDSASQLGIRRISEKTSLTSQISICSSAFEPEEGSRVKKLDFLEGGYDVAAALGVGIQDLTVFGSEETARVVREKSLASYKSLFDASSKGLCLVDQSELGQVRGDLEESGFGSSCEIAFSDQSVILFSLRDEQEKSAEAEKLQTVSLVYSKLHSATPYALADALTKQGLDVEIKTMEDGENLVTDVLTLLYNPAGTMLSRPDPTTFAAIKALFPSRTPVMWLTAGVNEGKCASASTVAGFLRVVREEEKMSNLRLLDFDRNETFESIAKAIATINNPANHDNTAGEHEYWLHRGVYHVSRIVPNARLGNRMDVVEKPAMETALKAGKPLRGTISSDGLTFIHNEALEKSAPRDDEVDIQVESLEFHKHDLQAAEEGPRLVCGKVIAIGSRVDSEMLGKYVTAYVSNPHDTIVRSPATLCVECHPSMGNALTSLLPNICKAASALRSASGSVREKTVLLLPTTKSIVHSFALLSKPKGFKLTVIQQAEPTDNDVDSFGTLQVSDLSGIYQAMQNAGSSLVMGAPEFSSLARELWRKIPSGASFFLMDNGASMTTAPDATPFTRGARFSTTSIASTFSSNPRALQKTLLSVLPIAQEESRRLLGKSANVLSVKSVRESSLPAEDGAVLAYNYGQDIVRIIPPPFKLQLSSEDVYLLAGCLGGLGRSLTSWMMDRGAKHFAFISRSGADKPEAAQLIKVITEAGATPQVFRCDAANMNDVTSVINTIASSGRLIKGVVHAAMLLEDAILGSSMTLPKFTTALRPKVDGALALHHALKDQPPLDFFVMTSSISATVGQPGQSNYAAANSVLDNIALQRNLAGQPATSMILPMVLGVGVVAENDSLEEKISRRGMYGIEEREMLRAFEAAMSQPAPKLGQTQQMDAAIVLGLDPSRLAETWAAAGEDTEISWMEDARFAHLRQLSDSVLGKSGSGKSGSGVGGFAEQVAEAASGKGYEAALMMTAGCIMQKCGSILMLPVEGFELDRRSIGSYGLDSMIGAELRNWLFKELGLNIAFQDLLATALSFKGLSKLVLDGFGITK